MSEFEQREDLLKQREKALDDREKDIESKCGIHPRLTLFLYLHVHRVWLVFLGREKILNEQEKILEQKLSR
jgi:hypothetical protein